MGDVPAESVDDAVKRQPSNAEAGIEELDISKIERIYKYVLNLLSSYYLAGKLIMNPGKSIVVSSLVRIYTYSFYPTTVLRSSS